MAQISSGAVAVVSEGFDDDGNAAGSVAFIGKRLIGLSVVFTGRLLDDALDVFIGNVVGLGLGNAVAQLGVGARVGAAAFTDGDIDVISVVSDSL